MTPILCRSEASYLSLFLPMGKSLSLDGDRQFPMPMSTQHFAKKLTLQMMRQIFISALKN